MDTVSKSNNTTVLTEAQLRLMDAYWRAANYLSVGQIYLLDNPLLKAPLTCDHVKPRLLGHWGTTPGLNFMYVHLNRIINEQDRELLFIAGPGHGGPAVVANVYLEGTYSEVYPSVSQDESGMRRLFKQFSFPGGIPSHVAPETPGSIHEGGELGYSLSHAYGAVFDNPNLCAVCVVGDGEAETGPLAAAWHSNKFLNPAKDGAVLPILHLNGYKIANPTLLARISEEELQNLMVGYGYQPFMVNVENCGVDEAHQLMAFTLEQCFRLIDVIQRDARTASSEGRTAPRARMPMIIFKSLKGWTGPKFVDGLPTEGSWRSHQVPLSGLQSNSEHLKQLEGWLRSYKPHDLFTESGALVPELQALSPRGTKRMSASPYSNCGASQLIMPDFKSYALELSSPGSVIAESPRALSHLLRDIVRQNAATRNFRVFGPDETTSNRLGDVFEATSRCFNGELKNTDEHIAVDGRVMEILSEHTCQGWLEGYLLTGRHGFFSCYEAFIHIVDSMFNQHAKWLKTISSPKGLCHSWRNPIPSLNYFLTSHVWRQDHNGFSHQDPGFVDHVLTKEQSNIIAVYFPPDANTLLCVADTCLRSTNKINVIVAGKQPEYQWVNIEDAQQLVRRGVDVWGWASSPEAIGPHEANVDVVVASCGDVPTLEALAAVDILRSVLPQLRIRFVNVVTLLALKPPQQAPDDVQEDGTSSASSVSNTPGLSDEEYDAIFTTSKPIIFAYHAYPTLIHRLVYRRSNHRNFHVRGYNEEGTTTTPFDMCVLNGISRFQLVELILRHVDSIEEAAKADVLEQMRQHLAEHFTFIRTYGDDLPVVKNWKWSGAKN